MVVKSKNMKKNSVRLLPAMNGTALQKLLTIVDETLVLSAAPVKAKFFTVADLWNIQRQKKCVRRRTGM